MVTRNIIVDDVVSRWSRGEQADVGPLYTRSMISIHDDYGVLRYDHVDVPRGTLVGVFGFESIGAFDEISDKYSVWDDGAYSTDVRLDESWGLPFNPELRF